MDKSDDLLIKETLEGDMNAFRTLVEKYHKSLINFFYNLTFDSHLSEDLSLEVFVKVFNSLDRYKSCGKFISFLYAVAKNHWIDYMRTYRSTKRGKPVSLFHKEDDEMTLEKIIADTDADDPPNVAIKDETSKYIRRILAELPEEQRIVIVLSEFQGMTYEEIAEALEIPLGTVKSRIHNAFLHLKKVFKQKLEE